jgi:hypothetical protein
MEALIDEQIEKMLYRDPQTGDYNCTVCGKSHKNKKNVERHIEARHIVNAHVNCEFCGNLFKNRESKRKHKCTAMHVF